MLIIDWCYAVLLIYLLCLYVSKLRFKRQRATITHRVHVNGIRGKSTVTRYVAAILRDSGLHTYGKTTGTAARVILPSGEDSIIKRRGYPNVNEQLGMIRSFASQGAEATVIECMAVNPDYQGWLEDTVMHSHIGIITNVRIDHQEEMGHGLLDIARSIARTTPSSGVLITAEHNPKVLAILRAECERKQTRLIEAPVGHVKEADLKRFNHFAHRENVAIGLAVAKLYGISPKRALQSMVACRADPGAFEVKTIRYKGKIIKWANLFAVNDKESFAELSSGLAEKYAHYHRIAILNNRHDRPSRVLMFCRLARRNLRVGTIIAFGDFERQVLQYMERRGIHTLLFGNKSKSARLSGEALFEAITSSTTAKRILLVGAVNIHTQQAEHLLEFIAEATGEQNSEQDLQIYNLRPGSRFSIRSRRVSRRQVGGGLFGNRYQENG
jgi:poly-gamma-glutamate synthase PgsB/CapB